MMFLQLALSARTDFLVSGDADLTVLRGAVPPVQVVSAMGLKAMLERAP